LEPELESFEIGEISASTASQCYSHEVTLEKWKDNHIPAENAHISEHPIEGHKEISIMKPVFQMADPGQKANIEIIGKTCRVTKLL